MKFQYAPVPLIISNLNVKEIEVEGKYDEKCRVWRVTAKLKSKIAEDLPLTNQNKKVKGKIAEGKKVLR